MQPDWHGAEQVTSRHDPGQHDPPQHDPPQQDTSLVAVLLEVERHVGSAGWDQPARLFALVSTARLITAEPALADRLGRPSATLAAGPDDHLTAVEQEHFVPTADLVE